jgi:hypothetical protein
MNINPEATEWTGANGTVPKRTGGSEIDPVPHQPLDTYSRKIAADRIAMSKAGEPEPPVHGVYGGWDR